MSIQTKANRNRFSRLRQALLRLVDELPHLIEPYLSDGAVIKGSVYELRRKCGKPRCKCVKGELHSRMVVSASEKGRTRMHVIARGKLVEVKIKVRRYQELRQLRARVVKIHKEMLRLMDQIEAMRREQMD